MSISRSESEEEALFREQKVEQTNVLAIHIDELVSGQITRDELNTKIQQVIDQRIELKGKRDTSQSRTMKLIQTLLPLYDTIISNESNVTLLQDTALFRRILSDARFQKRQLETLMSDISV